MSKLLILKGLPASGKSTYAKELVAKGWKRVNKDDLRAMIDDSNWSREKEKYILNIEKFVVAHFLAEGLNVVVDDTNFGHESAWTNLASQEGCESEIKFFDTPVMECVARDAKRGDKSVGAKVIFRMYNQYLLPKPPEYNPELPDAYIFDIDGTLAKMAGRSPYDYTKVSEDKVNTPIAELFKKLNFNHSILVVSGRESTCLAETSQWLLDNDLHYKELMMRSAGDHRDDRIVKQEIYEKYIKGKYNVLAVFDDRDRVVEMWRSLGLTCLQVDYGSF